MALDEQEWRTRQQQQQKHTFSMQHKQMEQIDGGNVAVRTRECDLM